MRDNFGMSSRTEFAHVIFLIIRTSRERMHLAGFSFHFSFMNLPEDAHAFRLLSHYLLCQRTTQSALHAALVR